MRGGMIALALASAIALSACGDSTVPGEGDAASSALKMLDDSKIAGMLSTEAKAALDILGQGARTEIEAYKAQYGQLPANLSDLASLQTARAAAVSAITDALAEQVPTQRVLGGHHLVEGMLVLGELANQRQNEREIVEFRGANAQGGHRRGRVSRASRGEPAPRRDGGGTGRPTRHITSRCDGGSGVRADRVG